MNQLSDFDLDRVIRAHDPADDTLTSAQEQRRDALLARVLATPRTDSADAASTDRTASGTAPHRTVSAPALNSGITAPTDHLASPVEQSRDVASKDSRITSSLHPVARTSGLDSSTAPTGQSAAHDLAVPHASDELAARRERRRAPRRLRWLAPVAAAAAIGTALWVAQPGSDSAFASWTAQPSTVSPEVLATAQKACLDHLANPPGGGPTGNFDANSTVLADQRGNFLLLSLASEDGSDAQCFFDANRPSRVQGMTGGIVTPDTPPLEPLAADEVEWNGAGMSSSKQGTYAFTTGRVGADVAEVRLRTEGKIVTATLRDGHLAAWWPSDASLTPNAPMPPIAVDATLRDGTVLTDVNPEDRPGPREFGPVGEGGGVNVDTGEASTTRSGPVGSDVRAVTVRIGGHTVEAEMVDGGFVAEWPADTPGKVTYDLTYTDGTKTENAQPRE